MHRTRKLLIAKGARILCAKDYKKPSNFGLGIIPENGFDERKKKCYNGNPRPFLVTSILVGHAAISRFGSPKKC
jgi:hypothetical protein